MNKQEENTKKCIEIYFKEYNEHCYEGTCSYAIYSPKAAVYDLPFCSPVYAYFVSNFLSNLNFFYDRKRKKYVSL